MRGYCKETDKDEDGEKAIFQIDETVNLENAPDINKYDDSKLITDKAGFAEVKTEFINIILCLTCCST